MGNLDVDAATATAGRDLHRTTRVGRHQHLGLRVGNVVELRLEDLHRQVVVCQIVDSGAAAADV